MKKVILLLLVLNVVFSSAVFLGGRLKRSTGEESNSSLNSPDTTVSKPRLFAQKLDHFNPADNRKWNQRYWFSKKHFKKGGAALLITNGEWAVEYDEAGDLDGDGVVEPIAKELKAVIVSLEHRFHGKSWPSKKDMNYLSVGQAVADIANFVKGVTQILKLPKDTKWIVIGCSYGGILTTWARLKYPHLIHGALASSAPILAAMDYYQYHQISEESLNSYDQKCVESFTMVSEEIARLINGTENIQNTLQTLSICDDNIKNTADLATFLYDEMAEILSSAARGNDPTTPINIPSVCKLVMNHTMTKLEIFKELRTRYLQYQKIISDWVPSLDKSLEPWNYQRCSEFGFFSSYYSKSSLFVLSQMIPIETEVKKICGKFYGPNFGIKELREKVSQTNFLYGGLDMNIGNMIFTHGSLDPWYADGLYQKKDGALYETIFINGTSHCSDVIYSETDPPQLKNARAKALNIMKGWMQK